jgi:hypothetical protein
LNCGPVFSPAGIAEGWVSAFFGDNEKIQKTWILIAAGSFKSYNENIQFGN